MQEPITKMRREVEEIPQAVDRLLSAGGEAVTAAAAALREVDPPLIATVARGSSDHVATYLKYASELLLGVPVASIGPSVASVYRAPLKLGGAACIGVSQSGQSPDIVAMAQAANAAGALSIAITNDPGSPLARASGQTLDIHAGPELSVAATKTFVTSAVAGLWMLAEWRGDEGLVSSIRGLPDRLAAAAEIDWAAARTALEGKSSAFTLGRGPAYAMSNEAALKFKETCQIHAESYSSAEVLHGPVSIVESGFPVIALAAGDAAEAVLVGVADEIAEKGASVFVTSGRARVATPLEAVRTAHPLTDPLTLIVSVYSMVERVAVERGINPDAPRHLRKVTETV